eukprot:s3235_g1.t1
MVPITEADRNESITMATANGDDGASPAEAKVTEEEAARVVIDLAEAVEAEAAGDQEAPAPKSAPAGKGPGKGPPLPKPQARRVVQISPTPETSATRSPSRFHFQRPQNCQRGGVLVMSSDPADRDLAILVRHLTDSGRHQKDVRIDMALLNLGRLRALRYERNLFNAATRPVDGQWLGCSLLKRNLLTKTELEEYRKDIECGYVQFNALGEVFYPGEKVWMTIDGLSEPLGLTVLQSWYQLRSSLFGPEKSFHVELEFLASVGNTFAKINFQEPMSSYQGTRRLDSMLYQLMTNDMMQRLKHRGEKYLQAATSTPYVHYARGSFYSHGRSKHAALSDGRVMLDTQRGDHCSLALQQAVKAFKLQMKHGTESLRIVQEPTTEELWMAWPALVGFSFTAKCWGQVLVSETSPIEFRADAFEQLVLPAPTKEIIKSAVRHASSSGLDFISGKGDNTIFLLYGPPGCGKTLTAEAIAEMLRMPLYVVTAGDLGITAQEVEQNLSQVLHLCSEWNALTLIDEADIFLEARSTSELQRNALVCVMLRLLEYHQGILFLTTNRASNIDPAVRSRITVALHYEALNVSGRESVWRNLLKKLGLAFAKLRAQPEDPRACPEIESHLQFVKVPHGSVEPASLARHVLNGRQIKSCLVLAIALAAERKEELCDALIERAVAVVGEPLAGTEDKVLEPHPTRRVLMPSQSATTASGLSRPSSTPRDVGHLATPRLSREGLLQPKSSVHPVLPSSMMHTPSAQGATSISWARDSRDLRSHGVLGHDSMPFAVPIRIPDPAAFGAPRPAGVDVSGEEWRFGATFLSLESNDDWSEEKSVENVQRSARHTAELLARTLDLEKNASKFLDDSVTLLQSVKGKVQSATEGTNYCMRMNMSRLLQQKKALEKGLAESQEDITTTESLLEQMQREIQGQKASLEEWEAAPEISLDRLDQRLPLAVQQDIRQSAFERMQEQVHNAKSNVHILSNKCEESKDLLSKLRESYAELQEHLNAKTASWRIDLQCAKLKSSGKETSRSQASNSKDSLFVAPSPVRLSKQTLEMLRCKIKTAAYEGPHGQGFDVIFNRYDQDGSGCLSAREVRRALRRSLRQGHGLEVQVVPGQAGVGSFKN